MHDPVTQLVASDVQAEMDWQKKRYGAVNATLLDGTGPHVAWTYPMTAHPARDIEAILRSAYEKADSAGVLTWRHLVLEEVCEAFQESDSDRLYAELKQVAALVQSWMAEITVRQVTQLRAASRGTFPQPEG